MAEATSNQDQLLREQPIFQYSSSPSITSSIKYDSDELCNQIEAMLEQMGKRSKTAELLERCRSPSPESIAVTNSSGSTHMSPIDDSFSEVDSTNEAGSEDKKDVRNFVQKRPQQYQAWHEADEDDGIKYIDHIHPIYRLNTMPCYAVRDHQGYGCFLINTDSASCDGPSDKRSPENATRISQKQHLGPGWSQSITFKDLVEIRARASALARARAVRNVKGKTNNTDSTSWVEPQYYLKLTDRFRDVIEKDIAIYDGELSMLSAALQDILDREVDGLSPLSFQTIVYSRLDKLLMSIIHNLGKSRLFSQANVKYLLRLAVAIEGKWHIRYKDNLFDISTERLSFMLTHGMLAHVSMKPSAKGDGSASWAADKRWRGAGTDLLDFPLGHWWPNAACAIRDGAVNLTRSETTNGYQHILYTFLLAGFENIDKETGFMKYTLDTEPENFFVHLQCKVRSKIRVLRGYKLKSHNAPKIGVRYDGVYILKRLGFKVLDEIRPKIRMELYYDAVEDESGINDSNLMKQSTIDDWDLYRSFEKAEMKKHCSPAGYYAWQTGEEQELADCQEWHRREKLRQHGENLHV